MSSPAPYSADFCTGRNYRNRDRRKIDPQNIEAEKSVLAACMLQPGSYRGSGSEAGQGRTSTASPTSASTSP